MDHKELVYILKNKVNEVEKHLILNYLDIRTKIEVKKQLGVQE